MTGTSRRWGTAACLTGMAAGWARVYLGVHFPADVLASMPARLLAAGLARASVPPVRRWVVPPAEHAYGTLLRLITRRKRVAAGLAFSSDKGDNATC